MSLILAAEELRKYNKKSQNSINTQADETDQTPNLGAWSYANVYDALYERFSSNKNFNAKMLNQAIKSGDQDVYLSFLEQNQNTQLSEQFYDPQYYNYESMMLELYNSFTDTTDKKEQFTRVWDARTQSYVKESLGEMSEREYIQYQIDQAHKIRNIEITRQLEQDRKDNMSGLEKIGSTMGAALAEFGEGVISALSGILDFLPAFVYATDKGLQDNMNWLDAYVDYYAEVGLTANEKETVRKSLDEWERTHTYIQDIDGNLTGVGKYMAGIANSMGMMIPAILSNLVIPGIGMPLFYTSIYGHNIYENAHNPATKDSPSWMKITNAAIKTGVEVIVEYGLDKMLGGTIQNQMLGLSGKGIIKQLGKSAGLKYLAKSAVQEGLEEFLQDFGTNLVDQFTGMIYEGYQHTGVNFQTLIDSFLIGALSSIFMTGGAVARNAIVSKATKGKSDIFIETETGDLKKIKGLNYLAWSTMMQDFNKAIKTLEKGKMNIDKSLDLAQEVYGGITVMAQFYQSFSTERIVNAEKLLQRVANAEQRQISFMGKTVMNETATDFEARRRADIDTFTDILHKEFTDMVGEVGIRYGERVKKAMDVIGDKLKEAGVTEIKNVVDKEGTKYQKDPDIIALEQKLQSAYNEFGKEYDFVFTTDGHIAIEVDGMLFVSEAWLENYETSDIYKFLAQEQILQSLLTDKELAPMLKEVVKHNKQFTKRKSVTTEQALMDLLFNKSVYQHFLLSNKGKNLHKFKDFIFQLHELVKSFGQNQKLTKARKNYLNQIYEQIKDTMREPTIKAIINWKMNPQLIGADSVLTEADKQFINQYQTRQNVIANAAKGGKITASYEHIATDLRENGRFTDAEKALIDRGLLETATNNERLLAIGLLNEEDTRYVNYDFDQNTQERNMSPGAFVMPKQAFATGNDLAAYIQFKADILNEFKKIYGINAKLLYMNDTKGLSLKALDLITKEMEVLGVDNYRDFVTRKLENMLGDEYIVTPTYQVSDNKVLEYVRDFEIVTKIPAEQILISNILKGTLEARNQTFVDMFEGHTINNKQARMLSEFIKIVPGTTVFDIDSQILSRLHKWTIEISNEADADKMGQTNRKTKTISINIATSDDFIHNLVHEINHAIQYEYYLSRGFNKNAAFAMPDFLKHVLQNYPELIAYVLRRQGYTSEAKIITNNLITEAFGKPIKANLNIDFASKQAERAAAYIAYRLVQGELWAEHYMHNGKLVKGYTMQQALNGKSYIVSPDGKYKFEMPFASTISKQELSTRENIKPDPIYTQNATERTFNAIFNVRSDGYLDNKNIRNTYHSKTTKNKLDLIQRIINKGLPITTQLRVTINDIILNPEQYLSQEKLDQIMSKRGEITEGTTYHFLKDWFENNVKGISLDRDTITHEYLFVNDNAFDDLLTSELFDARFVDNDIVKKYTSEDGFNLNRFYSTLQLSRLGLPSNIKVIANNKVKTETVIGKQNPQGLIRINVNEKTTNGEFIDKLNHEFRHILQHHHGFEQGFTADFEVTPELMNDIKKNVPEIFKNKELINLAKYNKADPDTFIAQRFVYYMIGGEQNAYGIRSAILNNKPAFVKKEAGKYVIYMPWYNAKTGEGRYETKFLASRADDTKLTLPSVKRSPKYVSGVIEDITAEKPKKIYKYDRNRQFSNEKARGTNLEAFIKGKGKQNDMDPDLQNFIIATTGHLDKLPKELAHAIRKGIKTTKPLNMQRFYAWFREANPKDINDFTFNLINKYMFNNPVIQNMTELEKLTQSYNINYWLAAVAVLQKEGLNLDTIIAQNSVQKFADFIDSLEGTKWKSAIENMVNKLNWYTIFDRKTGKYSRVEITSDVFGGTGTGQKLGADLSDYMRVLIMQYFDGSLAGAFYTARYLRYIVRKLYEIELNKNLSLDTAINVDDEKTFQNTITEDNKILGLGNDVGNSIIAAYNLDFNKNVDEMIYDLGIEATIRFNEKADELLQNDKYKDFTNEQKKKLKENSVAKKVSKYITELRSLTEEELNIRFQEIRDKDMTGLPSRDITEMKTKDLRINIVNNIKNLGGRNRKKTLQKLVSINDWKNIPLEVRNMFDGEGANAVLKPEVYKVGRGRTKGNIGPKDTIRIIENRNLLKKAVEDANNGIFSSKDKEIGRTVRRLENKLEKEAKKRIIDTVKNLKPDKKVKETEFSVNKRKRTSDQPNNFTVISGIDMPSILRKIFDVSFEEMASTEVQFASRDKDGNLLDRETMGKAFDAALKHEVSNWDVFYEAVREQLLNLTRTDVLDIVEFIQMGATTFDGPANKLAAFQIFILGYIVDGVRHNFNNWNFSDAEIKVIEELYERKASEHGSGLNAVGQMLKVIDPMKKIRQRMLENYNITEDELKPLFDAVDKLQQEKTLDARKTQAVIVENELQKIQKMMFERELDPRTNVKTWSNKKQKYVIVPGTGETVQRGFGKRWYKKLKSARYSFMLSSPITWIRNMVSNVIITAFNSSADFLGKIVFAKKGYREGQWNLAGTQISAEVKAFIDNNIKNSELFELLYDGTTKYDDRAKKVGQQKELFVTMIVNAIERKYAAEHKFDSTTANLIAKFVNRMISDKRFIKFAAGRYLGKILTIEVAKGKVDLANGLSNEVLDLFAVAVIEANMDYMHKRSFLADMVDGVKDKSPVAYEVMNWLQPFINSSFNWFLESLKYTGLGLISGIYKMATLEKQITKLDERRAEGQVVSDSRMVEALARRDIGKGMIGLVLLGLGVLMSLSGIVKIEDDDDKFYLIVGDVKIDISNIFGSSSILTGISLAQVGKVSFDDIMKDVWENMLEGFLLKDILDRHKWNKGPWEAMLTETESILRSFVPQMVQLIIRATNNESIRYTKGFKGMWERWLNSWIPTQPFGERKINPYTGEVETKYAIPFVGEFLKSGLLGPRIFWSEVSEIEAFAREYGINKIELTGEITIDGKKHSFDKQAVNKKYGELNKKSLSEIQKGRYEVQMPDGTYKTLPWSQMSDLQRARVINRVMTQNAEIAKISVWTQDLGHKYYASDTFWLILKQLGIIKNIYKGGKGFVE